MHDVMAARIVLGYGDRQYHIFPDELTTFLMNCAANGLDSVEDIAQTLENPEHEKHLYVIQELGLLLKGMIYEP